MEFELQTQARLLRSSGYYVADTPEKPRAIKNQVSYIL